MASDVVGLDRFHFHKLIADGDMVLSRVLILEQLTVRNDLPLTVGQIFPLTIRLLWLLTVTT